MRAVPDCPPVSPQRRPRVLITRTRLQASALAERLERMGAETVVIPTIEVVQPTSFAALDAAVQILSLPGNGVDWLLFTSANAVQAIANRARAKGVALYPNRVAAIGPATAKAAEEAGIVPASGKILLPPRFVAESLAEALLKRAEGARNRLLLVRAEEARDVIPESLRAAGHLVTVAPAYRNRTPPETLPELEKLFAWRSDYPDAITFTSSSTARNLVTLLETLGIRIPPELALASIGPITSATLRELGYEPSFEAEEPTVGSLANAIAVHLGLG